MISMLERHVLCSKLLRFLRASTVAEHENPFMDDFNIYPLVMTNIAMENPS
jgi:hypothetical protein